MRNRKSISLSDNGVELLDVLARTLGIARSAVLELTLRKYAAIEGIQIPEPKPAPARAPRKKVATPEK